MTGTEAAIAVAQTALIGTVVASGIAVVGTIVSGLLGPFLVTRAERSARARDVTTSEKRRLLRDIEGALFDLLTAETLGKKDTHVQVLALSRLCGELDLWLNENEEVVTDLAHAVVEMGDTVQRNTARLGAYNDTLTRWFRGEITVETFRAEFDRESAKRIARHSAV